MNRIQPEGSERFGFRPRAPISHTVSMNERPDWDPEEVIRQTLRVLVGFVVSGLLQSWAMHPGGSGGVGLPRWMPLVLGQVSFHAVVLISLSAFLRTQ